MNAKILVTGGDGRFAKILKKKNEKLNLIFKSKKELNILKPHSIEKCIKKEKQKFILHSAGLSRPMKIHEKNISKSIDLNIIGTCNIVKICEKYKIKLIYLSTGYVYEGTKGNYNENDPKNHLIIMVYQNLVKSCKNNLNYKCKNTNLKN